jgi:DNA-binding NtrC family response regulator
MIGPSHAACVFADKDCAAEANRVVKRMLSSILKWHTSTVLVTQPDQGLRGLACRALSHKYHVIPTASPEEAVRIAARRVRSIDLLVSEVRLENMAGWELADLLRLDYPNLKVVYLSSSLDAQVRARMRSSIVVFYDAFCADLLCQAVHDALKARSNKRRPNLDLRVLKPLKERVVS